MLEIIKHFENACGLPIPVEVHPRRDHGVDLPVLLCCATRAMNELSWAPKITDHETMCELNYLLASLIFFPFSFVFFWTLSGGGLSIGVLVYKLGQRKRRDHLGTDQAV